MCGMGYTQTISPQVYKMLGLIGQKVTLQQSLDSPLIPTAQSQEQDLIETELKVDYDQVHKFIGNRGPDYQSQIVNGCYSSVLHLRGALTPQPLTHDKSMLFYNGEIFSFAGNQNDGEQLFDYLQNAQSLDKTFAWLCQLEADMSFVFVDGVRGRTIVYRDVYGKRSLIVQASLGKVVFSSVIVAEATLTFEAPANTMLVFDSESLTEFTAAPPSTIRFSPHLSQPLVLDDSVLKQIHSLFCNAIEKRTGSIPFDEQHTSVLVMFSGGLDSTILAALCCELLPPQIEIDLVNVSFSPSDAPDRITSILSFFDLLQRRNNVRLICADYSVQEVMQNQDFQQLLRPKQTHMDFNIASALHYASKGKGKLFSTSFFQHKSFIDLLQKTGQRQATEITGKTSYDFGLVTTGINIDPQLYYGPNVGSNAKVVLSGLGADEVWGGYARYKTAFLKEGQAGLQAEMSTDLDRLWHRNMGRDDRAISHNGKEARFPFLDLDLQKYLASVPSQIVVDGKLKNSWFDTDLSRGTGDKFLLRQYAAQVLNLQSATFEKRAIQFGTRIAKQTNVAQFGSNRKANGKAQFK